MKLSGMFAGLSRGAKDLEGQVAKWETELESRSDSRSDELIDSAETWLAGAQKRDEELRASASAYLADASDRVKAQWVKAQADWDTQIDNIKARTADMRQKAESMRADEAADWYEAYAAQAVSFAQRMQEEASNAVAAAAEARAAANKKA